MNCEQFDQVLTDYLENRLDPERTEALMAHIEVCDACRRELRAFMQQDQELERYFARERERLAQLPNPLAGAAPVVVAMARPRPLRRLAWAAAALVLIALSGVTWQAWRLGVPTGDAALATIQAMRGDVLLLDESGYRLAAVGDAVRQGRPLKVGGGGYAALALAGAGNRLEVNGGTRLSLNDFPDRLEVAVNRGQVWASLPTHPAKPFVIRTAQLTATAHGTVYGVEEELDRSIVRVAEGIVDVASGVMQTSLAAGQTYNSLAGALAAPASAALAWIQDGSQLAALTAGETTLAGATDQQQLTLSNAAAAATPTSPTLAPTIDDLTRLLPPGTRFFVELRGWPTLMEQFNRTDYSALLSEPSLQQWWRSVNGQQTFRQMIEELKLLDMLDIARMLDGQIVAGIVPGVTGDAAGSRFTFLILADCQGHEQALQQKIDELYPPEKQIWNAGQTEQLQARVARGRLVVTLDPGLMQSTLARLLAGESAGFGETAFGRKIDRAKGQAPLAVALDLAGVLDPANLRMPDDARATYDFLGLGSLDYALIAPQFAGHGMNQAARLGFKEQRAGMLGWLAAPGTMRGLDFFSPETRLFGAAVLKNPRLAYMDLMLSFKNRPATSAPGLLLRFLGEHRDLLDAIGGEVAVGIENPMLPVPNVKVVVEMRDPAAFPALFNALVNEVVTTVSQATRTIIVVNAADHKGRTIYSLVAEGSPIDLSWAFVDDFLVLGPGPRFVQHSIDVHDSGRGIGADSRLLDLLPQRTGSTFSLLVYQNIAADIPDLLKSNLLANADPARTPWMPDISFLSKYNAPGIAYAYAGDGSIDFYLNTPTGIDLNMGMAIPVVANWLTNNTGLGASLAKTGEAEKRLDQLAAAATVFKGQTGQWPQTLSDLLGGAYLDRIPEDPFGLAPGDTLRMIAGPGQDQVTFYSIGPDGTDDRGSVVYDPIGSINGTGDIVITLPLAEGTAGTTAATVETVETAPTPESTPAAAFQRD